MPIRGRGGRVVNAATFVTHGELEQYLNAILDAVATKAQVVQAVNGALHIHDERHHPSMWARIKRLLVLPAPVQLPKRDTVASGLSAFAQGVEDGKALLAQREAVSGPEVEEIDEMRHEMERPDLLIPSHHLVGLNGDPL